MLNLDRKMLANRNWSTPCTERLCTDNLTATDNSGCEMVVYLMEPKKSTKHS